MARKPPKRHSPDRLFNPTPVRSFRRSYSSSEARWGFLVLGLLGLILGWVVYEGAHPDPSLFAALAPRATSGPASAYGSHPKKATPARNDQKKGDQKKGERGLLPDGLAPAGWKEGRAAQFTASNLYEKINGRASFFKSYGFKRLSWVMLAQKSGDETVDIELYDLGSPQNALGCYAGEKAEGEDNKGPRGGLYRIERNALYLARGRFYLRAIGSSEKPAVQQALSAIRKTVDQSRKLFGKQGGGKDGGSASSLPWGYQLFKTLGLSSSAVSYVTENAFSFAFGRGVYTATRKDKPHDAASYQLFAVATASATDARRLAERFVAVLPATAKKQRLPASIGSKTAISAPIRPRWPRAVS
jgi:hypothetical protein